MVEAWIGLVINHKIISRSQLLFKTPPVSETVTFKKRRGYSQVRTLDPRAVNMVVMAGPLKVTIQNMRHTLLQITVPNRTMINTIWTASNRINLARKLHISHQLRTILGRKSRNRQSKCSTVQTNLLRKMPLLEWIGKITPASSLKMRADPPSVNNNSSNIWSNNNSNIIIRGALNRIEIRDQQLDPAPSLPSNTLATHQEANHLLLSDM